MLRLPVLEPDKAYIGSSMFLPRHFIAEGPVKRALTFGMDPQQYLIAWKDHPDHIEVPRNYKSVETIRGMGIQVVDLRPRKRAKIALNPKEKFTLRAHQKPAWANMRAALDARQDFLLRLAPGAGKTVLGWLAASYLSERCLVISGQKAHLHNWLAELRTLFDFQGSAGWISGSKLECEADIVFCTIQTLVRRLEDGKLPQNFAQLYGLTIYDEVHHMAAKWFGKGADISRGVRIGLTATLNRKDRCEGAITSHLGPVIYDDPEEDRLIPLVNIRKTGVEVASDNPEVLDKFGQPNISKLRSWLGSHDDRNALICDIAVQRFHEGHKVYILSHSKDHVYKIGRELMLRGIQPGIITGDDKDAANRLRQLNGYPIVVATVQVGKEAYNRPELSCLILATPMTIDPHAPTEWVQSVGRIQRPLAGKKDPIVEVLWDEGVQITTGMLRSIANWCANAEWPVAGDPWDLAGKRKLAINTFRR